MGKIDKAGFQNLKLKQKYNYLREQGKYVASRSFGSFEVHLYSVAGFYAEVWLRVAFQQLAWIETVTVDQVQERYPWLRGIR